MNSRLYEIDLVKGVAVILMIYFHIHYLGTLMGKLDSNYREGFIYLTAKMAHLTFIFVVGVNLYITYRINKDKNKPIEDYYWKQLKRILYMALIAVGISYISYLTFPDKWVKFGIIHFVTVGVLLLFLFVNKPQILGIIASIVLTLEILKNTPMIKDTFQYIPDPILFISGLNNPGYAAMDHFSLIPYLALIAVGILFGKNYYDNRPELNISQNNPLVLVGKHSLSIYLMHFAVIYIYFRDFH